MVQATDNSPAAARARLRNRRSRSRLLLLLVPVVLVLAPLFVAEPVEVNSGSMSPTLRPGDEVLVVKMGGRAHSPHRHDVVMLHSPWTGQTLVKRVAAVAGDSVGIEDGVLIVNGRSVAEPYVDAALMDSVYFGPVTVPAGQVFVLGDNRPNSVDSRVFGAVPRNALIGRVVERLWPPR